MTEQWIDKIELPDGKVYNIASKYEPPLLSHIWTDHIIDRMDMLSADTFSWHYEDMYELAYNELLAQYTATAERDNKTEGGVVYRETPKGFKIADPSQEQAIEEKYKNDGIAWYYILDTTNKRFKLPRAIHRQLKNEIDVHGNGMTLGLQDINGNGFGLTQFTSTPQMLMGLSGTYGGDIGTAYSGTVPAVGKSVGLSADETKSGIIADVTNANEETKFHLYFYVGQFTQDIINEAAGISTEVLNAKADIDAQNFTDDGKAYLSGLGMPSGRYVDLSLGASGTVYTAPANGYVYVMGSSNDNSFCSVMLDNLLDVSANITKVASRTAYYGQSGSGIFTYVPVSKGDIVKLSYIRSTIMTFRFIYAKGD